MCHREVPKGKWEPEIIVSSKAQEVARGWVRKMTGGAESDSDTDSKNPSSGEVEARPPRLGLGAKYLPQSQLATTLTPVDKKLRAMTNTAKKLRGQEQRRTYERAVSRSEPKESNSSAGSEDEDEVKGSSHGRQQRRIESEDLVTRPGGLPYGKGKKRRR